MVGVGFHVDFLRSRCSSCARHLHLFILGLMLTYCTSISSQAKCNANKSRHEHCKLRSDGVRDLDCYGKFKKTHYKCVWRPGNHTSKATFTLIVRQPRILCKVYSNVAERSKVVSLYLDHNVSVEVFENGESTLCTRAEFAGSPRSMLRCDPPRDVSFRRQPGNLDVDVSWSRDLENAVQHYSVRYKAAGGLLWLQPPLRSADGRRCSVEGLDPSLAYDVQIRCVTSDRCSQCPWSETFAVPPELTAEPVIVQLREQHYARTNGSRLLSVKWQYSAKEPYEHFAVSVCKESGETLCERLTTARPEIGLVLSYSAYRLSISAVNNVSTSPAVSRTVPRPEDTERTFGGKLNVTVHSNRSFTVYWKDNLIRTYVCYSAEWGVRGRKAASMSFYQNAKNHRTLSLLPEPLEPYKRYSITLHTRPDKETCNMKRINTSESTYGTAQFYYMEGAPVSAPNISSHNVTLNSMVLRWSSVAQEDVRGFLLGYLIHYTENLPRGTGTETNITVDPQLDTYELRDLKGGTGYQVQMSAFTKAGVGVRSAVYIFTTNRGYTYLSSIIILAVVATLPIVGSLMMKRFKLLLWPSIPNPRKSSAMQEMEAPCQMELLASVDPLKAEEWDTSSLHVIEPEDPVVRSMSPLMLSLLNGPEEEEDEEAGGDAEDKEKGDSPERPSDVEGNGARGTPRATGDASPADPSSVVRSPAVALSGDYTTMEMFQQQTRPQSTAVAAESWE